ncbi:MAG: hypothetical protein RJA81_1971 [Planctomycetota bacterium]|jgi:hypothetical protein
MPSSFSQGIQLTNDFKDQIRNEIHAVTMNWFVNRCPLVTRLPRVPVASTAFTIVNRSARPRTLKLAAAVATGDSSITFSDASYLMVGDVLELASGERVEVTGEPNTATNAVTVRRAAEGTTAATGAINDTVRLVGNSRTGAEVNQLGVGMKPQVVSQFCQTWQHPVQIGGSLQASTGFVTPVGSGTPLDHARMDALQNLMDDMETTSYYGKGEDPSVAARPKQKGLRSLISTNLVTNPTNAGSYKATDLIRDTLEKCRTNGGNPDVLLLSSNFMTGLAVWGHAVQRMNAGTSVFGVPINVFEAPFLGGITLIEAPLLRPYTAVALTSAEVRLRVKRNEFWSPRGIRGDAVEGDWIAEGAIELENESHHAWLEGVTGFTA